MTRLLLVDDDLGTCEMLQERLSRRGYSVDFRTGGAEALDAVVAGDFDVVVTDLNMWGMTGIELCERIVGSRPDVPVVVITAFGSLETAIAAIRAGAYDFITKPFEIEVLTVAVDRAFQHRALREEVKRLRRAVDESHGLDDMLGASTAMRRLNELVGRVAEVAATVLITGESGTGKEGVARALHRRGRRREGPFVPVNCAALPEPLLESELFGHARGAFTDAKTARAGLFLQANGGTLFLDEVGEIPIGLQPKLLRAIQERSVRPVGGDSETTFDARIVTATNRELEVAVEERRFREDLYYRLAVIRVDVPPLRARGNDVLLLAQHFALQSARQMGRPVEGITSAAAEKLLAYPWPGNVRELQNCIERAVALTHLQEIAVEDLPEKVRDHRRSHFVLASDDPSELVPLEEVERRYILRVLAAVGGHRAQAARMLGLDRKTLYRKLDRWEKAGTRS